MSQINKLVASGIIIACLTSVSPAALAVDGTPALRLAGLDKQAATEQANKIAQAFENSETQANLAAETATTEAQKIADALAAEQAALDAATLQASQAADAAKAEADKQVETFGTGLTEDAAVDPAEAEKLATEKAEAEKLAAEKAEAERLAAEKAAAEKLAAEKAAAEKLAAEKAEAERLAAEKAEAERLAAEKAAAEKLAAEIAAAEEEARTNPLGVKDAQQAAFMVYDEFPEITFNPPKPVKNPLTVYKLKNIVHNLPVLDGLTRLNIQKLAKSNSVIKGLKIWKAERKTLSRKLLLNNYKSFWFNDNVLDQAKANEVIATIENAENFALRPAAYKLDELKQLIAQSSTQFDMAWTKIPGDSATLKEMAKEQALSDLALNNAKLELALTHAALAYSRHASAGQLIPSSVDRNYDVHPVATPAAEIISHIKAKSNKGDLQTWLEAQNPQSMQFKALLAEFKIQSGVDEKPVEPIIVPRGKSLKKGNKSKRVIKLAMRLEQLGFFTKTDGVDYPNVVTAEVINSVKAYQESKGLKPDGIAGPATLGSLNYKKPDYLKTLLVNLERQRWMPRNLGNKHVLVNQAEFRLRVFENAKVTHTARVVIGKNKHQTPMFFNKIRSVVVNPYWNIPSSILYKEMKNKIIADPSYLGRNGYEVVGSMNWENATSRHVPFRVRQKPGGRNALGRVKFLFPNRHAIYLHDTPSKSLFNRASRAFSHGCIRVQNPELLALNLMGWSKNKFNSLVKAGRNRHFALKNKVPVYLTYMTATADQEGEMHYFRDVYGRDKAMAKALGVKQIIQKIADKRSANSPKDIVVGSN